MKFGNLEPYQFTNYYEYYKLRTVLVILVKICRLVGWHMSRIGKRIIKIPASVDLKVEPGKISAKGPKGELYLDVPPNLNFNLKDKELLISSKNQNDSMAVWGLMNSLVSNLVAGVLDGFEKKLEIQGVGYKASVQGNKLVLSLGFSHPVEVEAPKGITFNVEKNVITVSGIDKQLVGEVTAKIRALKTPEPYKGKGIRYVGEHVRRKAGKRVVGSGF